MVERTKSPHKKHITVIIKNQTDLYLTERMYAMKMKFYRCRVCGNIMAAVKESGMTVMCCGEKMEEIKPNTVDAAFEKHIPQFTVDGRTVHVKVGEAPHPMMPEHYIEWIAVQTTNGNQRKELRPVDAPEACFALCEGDEVKAVYAFCNLHGLWKKDN